MDTPSDPGDERLERRLRLGVRLVFYPLALGLFVFAWHARHKSEAPARATNFVMWSGRTAQGEAIQAAMSHDGRLASVETHLKEYCSDGSFFTLNWFATQDHFAQHGDDFSGRVGPVAGTDSYREPTMTDTRVAGRAGAHPHGTLTGQVTRTTAHGSVTCRSGPVTFTLRQAR
jgi:hypothetical protein